MASDTVNITIEPWETFINYDEDVEGLGDKIMLTMAVAMLTQITGLSDVEVWEQLRMLAAVSADDINAE